MSSDEIAELKAELAEMRETLAQAGLGRRRLFTGALAGLGAAAAGIAAASPAAAAKADDGVPGPPINVLGITVQPYENRNYGYFVAQNGDTAVFAPPATYDDSSNPNSILGTGPALRVVGIGPAVAFTIDTQLGTELSGGTISGNGMEVAAQQDSTAIVATSESGDTSSFTAVEGRAVLAQSSGPGSTITSLNAGTGPASYARADTTNSAAFCVNVGHGPGLTASGGRAAIHLSPGTHPSHPASGMAGDLYVDNTHRLWFCKGGTTWKQVA